MRHIPLLLALTTLCAALTAAASFPALRGTIADYLTSPAPPAGGCGVVVVKFTNRLYLFEDGRVLRRYVVATGREPHYTPEGSFVVVNRTSEPGDPRYGPRWLGLGVPVSNDRRDPPNDQRAPEGHKYGLHGTDEPESIGGYFSGGCVRLRNEDIAELYDLVSVGTRVEIRR